MERTPDEFARFRQQHFSAEYVSVRRVPTSEGGSGEPKIGSCLTQ